LKVAVHVAEVGKCHCCLQHVILIHTILVKRDLKSRTNGSHSLLSRRSIQAAHKVGTRQVPDSGADRSPPVHFSDLPQYLPMHGQLLSFRTSNCRKNHSAPTHSTHPLSTKVNTCYSTPLHRNTSTTRPPPTLNPNAPHTLKPPSPTAAHPAPSNVTHPWPKRLSRTLPTAPRQLHFRHVAAASRPGSMSVSGGSPQAHLVACNTHEARPRTSSPRFHWS